MVPCALDSENAIQYVNPIYSYSVKPTFSTSKRLLRNAKVKPFLISNYHASWHLSQFIVAKYQYKVNALGFGNIQMYSNM